MRKNTLTLILVLTVLGFISSAFFWTEHARSSGTGRLNFLKSPGQKKVYGNRTDLQIPFRQIVIDRDFLRYPHCKAVGDFNGDGLADVVVGSAFGQGLFWYAYPNWTKHRIDLGSYSTDMQVGDVDGDGDADVIIPKLGTGLVWYENTSRKRNPVQHSWKLHIVSAGASINEKDNFHHDVEVGDINGDGKLDVVK